MPLSRKIVTSEKALARLEELCVRGERCESELRKKLRTWQIASADADAVIDSLRRRRFFDDARFAHAFVTDKVRFARWGRIKIAMALRYKRIGSDGSLTGFAGGLAAKMKLLELEASNIKQ